MHRSLHLVTVLAIGCSAEVEERMPADAGRSDTGVDDAELPDAGRNDADEDDAGLPDVDDCADGPTCFSDFRCRGGMICASERSVQACRTVSCEETCGTTCCGGEGCAGGEVVECPAGQACYQNMEALEAFNGELEARCLTSTDAATLGWIAPAVFPGCR